MTDFLLYCLLKTAGPFVRALPLPLVFFIGRRLGDLAWCFDVKHRLRAYSHIKTAFGAQRPPAELYSITRQFYRSFGENFMEMLLIPRMDKAYIDRNVRIHGLEHVHEAFKRGKGVILVAVHAGGWEIANILCAHLGLPFSMFVRGQKLPRVERLLDGYRRQKGCRLIKRQDELRQLLRVLKANEATVLTVDQGGRRGTNVAFFGKDASMASGAVRLALKYGAVLLPVFPVRVKNSRVDFYVEPPFSPVRTGDEQRDLVLSLQGLVAVFERFIRRWPHSYLWTYRIWKYGRRKDVLIVSDGKAGHQRQSEALAEEVRWFYRPRGMLCRVRTVVLKYQGSLGRAGVAACGCLSGKYICQGCLACIRTLLAPECYKELISHPADVVISAGSAAAPVNYLISRENQATSLVVMRPSLQALNRFSGAIIPRHDQAVASERVAVVDGALNLIDAEYLERNCAELSAACSYRRPEGKPVIGLLIGGDNKKFRLEPGLMRDVVSQVKAAAQKIDADVLVTTSRRTPAAVEQLLTKELGSYPRCKLLVIANEKNVPFAVGGILGSSDMVICSPESISMISEAASSGAYTVVFRAGPAGRRHQRFLRSFAQEGYIMLEHPDALGSRIENIWYNKPLLKRPENSRRIQELLTRIL